MRWDNPGLGGSAAHRGGGGLTKQLLRDDEARLVLCRLENVAGSRLPWGYLCSFHLLASAAGLGSLGWHVARLVADPCAGTADQVLCRSVRHYWLLKAAVLLSTWELLMQSVYFVTASLCDWIVGQEATLLGVTASDVAPGAPEYAHHCQGWRFHLARVDAQSERVLRWRDRMFSLVYPICMLLLLLYWCVIFPSQPLERDSALASVGDFMGTLMVHGFSALALHAELLLTHHTISGLGRDMLALFIVSGLYVGTVVVCNNFSKIWPYPAVQAWAAQRWWQGLLFYGGAALVLLLLACILRVLSKCVWRRRIRQEMQHARALSIHQAASGFHTG
jgi:hypothetical protein